jgi:hypothetical protein
MMWLALIASCYVLVASLAMKSDKQAESPSAK